MGRERKTQLELDLPEESELDKFFGKKEDRWVTQERWMVLPTFDTKAIVEGTKPFLKKQQEILWKEGKLEAAQTNISEIEVFYPWILKRTGLIEELPEWGPSEGFNEYSLRGRLLHEVDSLFNALGKKIEGNAALSFFPQGKKEKEKMNLLIEILEKMGLNGDEDQMGIQIKLFNTLMQYKTKINEIKPVNMVLEGFGVEDPLEKELYAISVDFDEIVYKLAGAWAKELSSDDPLTWEFDRNTITHREVPIVDNMHDQAPVQFRGRLDSVSRQIDEGKVTSQSIDFKTGSSEFTSSMQVEVHQRQMQVMQHLAERFTAYYLRGKKSLQPRDNAFIVVSRVGSRAYEGRVKLAGIRHFDIEAGEFKLERAQIRKGERRNFREWLFWYGSMLYLFKDEIKALRKKARQYQLGRVEMPEEFETKNSAQS